MRNYGISPGGLAGTASQVEREAGTSLAAAAKREQEREIANAQIRSQNKAGQQQLGAGIGAAAGMMAGAKMGASLGPYGALFGAVAGGVIGGLF